ncbi:kinase-like domain-containing protein [Gigaspora rosea]|uniref:Kinase-like domain-containing protein n=1 Tax=Gigaspora rosea TaxID=44941 RepID=A0A397VDT5_9GLOM|nr:kinase-like domain-containing protein [Gigaspora rosea]
MSFMDIASSAVTNITRAVGVSTIKVIAKEINQIYVNSECNKETIRIMENRAKNAESVIAEFMKNDEKSKQKEYQVTLERLRDILTKIKEYCEKVSKLESLSRFFKANETKKEYDQLTEEYEKCIRDLALHSANYTKKEESQKVDKDLEETEKTLKGFDTQKAVHIQHQIANQSSDVHVKTIRPNELTEPHVPSKKKTPIKKFYGTIEVECKDFKDLQDSEDFRRHLAILEQLESPYIRRFYGISYVDTQKVMVFDWAEYGSLKDLYNAYNIPWKRKIQIIRDICRGLAFLRSVDILHHDIRCENVLVLHNLDPKLGNFRYARTVEGTTINLSNLTTMIIRWMAPELLMKYVEKKYDEKVYTFNCEMFSLGMLIWELCYEKLPYKDWDFRKISEHVSSGEREKLPYGKSDNQNDVKIQKEFIEIIKKTWQQVPEDRISITKLYLKLEELAAEYKISPAEPILLTKGTLDLEGENADTSSPDLMDLEKNEDENLECSSYGDDSNNDSNNDSKKDIKGKKRARSPVKTSQQKRKK